MDRLQHAVRFDSGLWATFTATAAGPTPHSCFLYDIPEKMLEEYERVKQYDLLNQEALVHAGRTLNVALAEAAPRVHPSMVKHAGRWGMAHTLATMRHESPINLFTAFCLYRRDPGDAFAEAERA
jgi:hypothetical protein